MSMPRNLNDELTVEYTEKLQKIWDTDYNTIISGKDGNGVPFLKYVYELHIRIFGQTCSTCPGEISGYITKLKKLNTTTKMETIKISKDFRFADDTTTIPVLGTSLAYSNANLTDEAAIELIAQNKKRLTLFSKVPDDLDDRLKAYKAANAKEDKVKKLNSDTAKTGKKDEGKKETGKKDDAGDKGKVENLDPEFVKMGDNQLTFEQAVDLITKHGLTTKAKTVHGVQAYFEGRPVEVQAELIQLASAVKDQPDGGGDANQDDEFAGMDKAALEFELDKAKQEHQDLVDDIMAEPDPVVMAALATRIEVLNGKLGITE